VAGHGGWQHQSARRAWINGWNDAVGRFEPRTARERLAFSQFAIEDDARTDAGVTRFRETSPSVPSPLWAALILGACLALALQLSMSDPRERLWVQSAMVGAVAAILTAGLLLVAYLDHPYSGEPGSIKPTAMQFSLTAMQEIEPGLNIPCSADGRPLRRG
jgi:hypothetical protein